jgi:type I restriction enzyme, S subunit
MSSDRVPEGYKQTEVGVVPEDWEVRKISSIGDVVRGGSPRPAGDPRFFNGSYVPWLTVASLTNIPVHQLNVYETHGGLTEEGAKRSRTLERGTIIIANSGATLGVAKILDIQCCANDGIAAVINQKCGDKQYICHFINTKTKELREVVATGNGQPNLNTTLIKELLVPFPPLLEQQTIAQALSDVDALIASLDKLIAKQRQLKTAAMQQLLTGKMRSFGFGEGKGYKQSQVGIIPEDWDVSPLSDLIERLEAGVSVNSVEEDNGEYGHEQSVLKTSSVFNGEFFPNECKKISPKDIQRAKLNPQKDTIIISRMNTPALVGECGYVGEDNSNLFLPDRLWITRLKKNSLLNVRWLAYILSYGALKKAIKDTATGTSGSMKNIAKDGFLKIIVPCPKEKEQRAIATVLSDMDSAIAALENRRTKTQAIKQGMMQELLTGRTRLI